MKENSKNNFKKFDTKLAENKNSFDAYLDFYFVISGVEEDYIIVPELE